MTSAVAGVVVTHGPHAELDRCLAALGPQVDELLVVSNPPAPAVDAAPDRQRTGARVRRQREPGHRRDDRPLRRRRKRGHGGEPGSRRRPPRLRRGTPALRHRRAPPAQLRRHVAALAQEVPDRLGHDRPPDAAPARSSSRRNGSSATTCSRSGPSIRPSPTGCSAPSCSCAGRCSTSSAASTKASASTARTSTSATGPSEAGWERWFVPQAAVRHAHAAVTDRRFLTKQTLWHWRSIARFVRKHPERLRNI